MIPVEQIEEGGFFKKKSGMYVYLRMSDSSAKFLGLDPDCIYGTCFNGNVAKVHRGVLVTSATAMDFQNNRGGVKDFFAHLFSLSDAELGKWVHENVWLPYKRGESHDG